MCSSAHTGCTPPLLLLLLQGQTNAQGTAQLSVWALTTCWVWPCEAPGNQTVLDAPTWLLTYSPPVRLWAVPALVATCPSTPAPQC